MINMLLSAFGALLALGLVFALFFFYIKDITQKKHAILRNYPIIGRLRYFFEQLGEYFRQYFFLGDRDERPFDRATRSWAYRLAKNEGGIIGFGSTFNLHQPGALIFVNAPFAVLEEDRLPTPPLLIGEGYCDTPFLAKSIVNVSGMSYGAISRPAVQALSQGARQGGMYG
jgi:glutamate synthase domain-containing protein 2